jgi:thioredoxin reductase (NADPH)
MTGLEFVQQASGIFPEAKRVLLTTFPETGAAIGAIKGSLIDDYLIKPCHPPELNLYPVLDDLLTDSETKVGSHFKTVRVIGSRFSPESHRTRDFLVRNCMPFEWLDIERDEARRLLGDSDAKTSPLPVVLFPDGSKLIQPANAEIARKIGLQVTPEGAFYDLVIVGGGPSGLAAAVYGASEGLRTVMVERHAPGGQAGLSAKIENYLGFPAGLSGADLARRAVAQARKFNVEIVTPQVVTELYVDGSSRNVTLGDSSQLRCHVVLLATGVQWRRLEVPGIDRLVGAGVYYGGTLAEALFCHNEDIYIVGGANSAGQAAVYFSRYARKVTMLVRGESLSESMSRYLIDQVEATKNIEVRVRTSIVEVHGKERLEAITIFDAARNERETVRTNALFIFIGALPHTEWLAPVVDTDDHGFILTGPDLSRGSGNGHAAKRWSLNRDPFWLESSQPGVFAAGDVRHGSVKRVAAGVGEGATAVQFIHQYLLSAQR